MKKVYIDKTTNIVSQIIKEDYEGFEDYTENTFGDMYYMIEAEDEEVQDHGYIFNRETLLFDRIKDYVETGVVEVISVNDKIKELENKVAELTKLLNAFTK